MTVFISHATAAECWTSGSFDALIGNDSFPRARLKLAGSDKIEKAASLMAFSRLEICVGPMQSFASNTIATWNTPGRSASHSKQAQVHPCRQRHRQLRQCGMNEPAKYLDAQVPSSRSCI